MSFFISSSNPSFVVKIMRPKWSVDILWLAKEAMWEIFSCSFRNSVGHLLNETKKYDELVSCC